MVGVFKASLIVLSAAAACGCSTVRFAYENADTYVRWKADSYVTLAGEDAEEFDDRVDEFHAWHRRTVLPKYAALAQEASRRFADGLSREDLVWGYDAARAQTRESLRRGAEMVAPLLDRLSAEQRSQIERRFVDENRQFQRNYLRAPERKRRARRAKDTAGRLEDWAGKLSPAQVQRAREYAERAPLLDELRDRDRKRLQGEFMAILNAREAQKRLPERAAYWDRGREPAYLAALEQWREQWFSLLIDVERGMTPEQRARVMANLRRYADDFEALGAR